MKKMLFCFLLSFSSLALADNSSQKLKFCESVSKYAKIIMHNRQHGEQAIDPINRLEKSLKDHQIKSFYIAIIKDAYRQPLWNSEEKKLEAETEFANESLMVCLDTFKD
ncbi:hypothetical protein [Acinetobacter oleivorans]|uniref:hypothetical protein n=1 Tax=Acinetobacter oleivorans TaxID=1148157 RepID=UPI00148F31C5|nr:hypothetical protein [Acinetobacter oleivorans]